MGQGISEVLTNAFGVAISPIPIVAVILMLFSPRALVNGLSFLFGWSIALTAVIAAAYLLSDAGHAATDSSAADGVGWSHIIFGAALLALAARSWRKRPAEGSEPVMPKWMAGVDGFTAGKAAEFGLLLAGLNPKNLLLALGAGSALAAITPSASAAVASIVVFVGVSSLTIAVPIGYYLVARDRAKAQLEYAKGWLSLHNSAIMTVLFLVFGGYLIAQGIPPLSA